MKKMILDDLQRISKEEFKKAKKTPIIVVLDNVRSLHNIGSFFRTCDAFLVEKILLCGITATPPNKEMHKTALGATETVDWEYYHTTIDAIQTLKADDTIIYALEQVDTSHLLQDVNIIPHKKYVLVFGNEVKGVDEEVLLLCDGVIEIPQLGTKHSLNVSVSGGVAIWEFFRKMNF